MKESNRYLQTILDTFTLTTGLYITSLNLNKDLTFKNKMNYIYSKDFNINKIYNSLEGIKNYPLNKEIKHLNIGEEKEVAIILLKDYKGLSNYFIIGPYLVSENKKEMSNIPYKPRYCINYIVDILIKIIDDKNIHSSKEKVLSLNIRKTIEYIHKFYEEPLTIDYLSENLNLHRCYFCNSFKQETGMTFTNFLSKFRVEKSKELLKDKSLSILDVAIAVGFNNQSYYTMAFKKFMNLTPLEYRKSL